MLHTTYSKAKVIVDLYPIYCHLRVRNAQYRSTCNVEIGLVENKRKKEMLDASTLKLCCIRQQ
jgi:hypothetical protein